MGVPHDPAWDDVTVQRAAVAHESACRRRRTVARRRRVRAPSRWPQAMAAPPTGTSRHVALLQRQLLRARHAGRARHGPALRRRSPRRGCSTGPAIVGPHLTTDGLSPPTRPVLQLDVRRLDRLGGAGTWMASTDDIAAHARRRHRRTTGSRSRTRASCVDQYGWGHTGTVDGAKACAWVLEDGRHRDRRRDRQQPAARRAASCATRSCRRSPPTSASPPPAARCACPTDPPTRVARRFAGAT